MATDTAHLPLDAKRSPFKASWGKIMMWIFLVSDAFTFASLLVSYGMLRVAAPAWPDPEKVFDAIPFFHGLHAPLVFVGIMTFILIVSSVTMVLAVEEGHKKNKDGVIFYLFLTVLGGLTFLGCQAWEWTHLIENGLTLYNNPYGGSVLFGQFFFLITGFHGGHVTSGVIINLIVLINTIFGTYERKGSYEIVEKVGLYWHFVDLVWVFVFTFFYLV